MQQLLLRGDWFVHTGSKENVCPQMAGELEGSCLKEGEEEVTATREG